MSKSPEDLAAEAQRLHEEKQGMQRREVHHIDIWWEDGTVTTFEAPGMFYKSLRNNKSHEKDHSKAWLEHEVRWTDAD